jgi:hypothetical protein
MKRAFVVLALMLMIPANAFSQAGTTISYNAVVTFASGPHSAVFPAGERVVISYTLNPLVADSNSDPQYGFFSNAVLSLSVSFPNIAVFAVAGPAGTAQTFDNVVDIPSGKWTDGVFFFGGPISSTSLLGGEPITFLEVDFGTGHLLPPAEPLLFSSDALPLFKLPIIDGSLFLGTSSGFTSMHFAEVTPHVAVEFLMDDVEALVAGGTLTLDQGDGLTDKLEAAIASLNGGNTRAGCNQLGAFINQANAFIRAGVLSPDKGLTLINAAEAIRTQIGC